MWVCSRVMLQAVALGDRLRPRPAYSCQMPKLEAGPPVLVRLVEPLPRPGFIRTETSPPGATPAELLELVERAGVEEHAARAGARASRARRHLGGELDALGREAGPQRPLDLVVARGVDVQAQLAEERQDAAARVGLHRVAQREAEGRREGERLPRRRLERGAIVDVAGRAEALAHLGGDLGGDVSGAAVGSGAFHPLESTASRLALEVLPAVVLEFKELFVPHRSEQRRDSTMRPTFQGSIVALVTPFRGGKVDESQARRRARELVEWHVASGTDGIVPCGTTGESPTLSHDEHKRVVELVIETARGRVAVIAGTGSNSTSEAIDLTAHAKKAGATGALVVNPYYNKPTQEGLYRHFRAVADAVDIPILVYNIAGRTAVNVETDTLARIVARLPEHRGRQGGLGLARPDDPGHPRLRPGLHASSPATTTSPCPSCRSAAAA